MSFVSPYAHTLERYLLPSFPIIYSINSYDHPWFFGTSIVLKQIQHPNIPPLPNIYIKRHHPEFDSGPSLFTTNVAQVAPRPITHTSWTFIELIPFGATFEAIMMWKTLLTPFSQRLSPISLDMVFLSQCEATACINGEILTSCLWEPINLLLESQKYPYLCLWTTSEADVATSGP